jgi:hypothetical protein
MFSKQCRPVSYKCFKTMVSLLGTSIVSLCIAGCVTHLYGIFVWQLSYTIVASIATIFNYKVYLSSYFLHPTSYFIRPTSFVLHRTS